MINASAYTHNSTFFVMVIWHLLLLRPQLVSVHSCSSCFPRIQIELVAKVTRHGVLFQANPKVDHTSRYSLFPPPSNPPNLPLLLSLRFSLLMISLLLRMGNRIEPIIIVGKEKEKWLLCAENPRRIILMPLSTSSFCTNMEPFC